LPKDEDGWAIIEQEILRIMKEIEERPKFIKLKWWQRLTHKHKTMFSGTVSYRLIERCECSYGRIDYGSWFKF
jgi:hypothetical protein